MAKKPPVNVMDRKPGKARVYRQKPVLKMAHPNPSAQNRASVQDRARADARAEAQRLVFGGKRRK